MSALLCSLLHDIKRDFGDLSLQKPQIFLLS